MFFFSLTFVCNMSGVKLGSYGIGFPTCVTIFTGNPPYIGANGSFVKAYKRKNNRLPKLTARNASLKFSVNTGTMAYM